MNKAIALVLVGVSLITLSCQEKSTPPPSPAPETARPPNQPKNTPDGSDQPKATPPLTAEPWQNDIERFRHEVARTLAATVGPPSTDARANVDLAIRAQEALAKFEGKPVAWRVTYQGIDQQRRVQLKESSLETAGRETVDKTAAVVAVRLDPAHVDLDAWKELDPGAPVTCRATLDRIIAGSIPGGNWQVVVGLKDAQPRR